MVSTKASPSSRPSALIISDATFRNIISWPKNTPSQVQTSRSPLFFKKIAKRAIVVAEKNNPQLPILMIFNLVNVLQNSRQSSSCRPGFLNSHTAVVHTQCPHWQLLSILVSQIYIYIFFFSIKVGLHPNPQDMWMLKANIWPSQYPAVTSDAHEIQTSLPFGSTTIISHVHKWTCSHWQHHYQSENNLVPYSFFKRLLHSIWYALFI